jgi:hypothetical protein
MQGGVAMLARITLIAVALVGLLPSSPPRTQANAATDEFAFLQPWFELNKKDRDTLATRGVVARGLPAARQQVSVIAACAVEISPEAFLGRVRALGSVKRDELVGGRFGEPPKIADLAPLTLDQGDIVRLRRCRPGECALNLADDEMSALQTALSGQPRPSTAVQDAFRRVVLGRVIRYGSHGLTALPDYHDRAVPMQPAAVFSEILQQTPYLKQHIPSLLDYLERFPREQTTAAESFLHWSKVIMNKKPVVLVADLTTFRPEPAPGVPTVLLAAKQVYASRYMNGELALWMLHERGSRRYLVYVHRSHLDELGGTFTALKRAVLEGGIKNEAAGALARLRDQLEHPF